MEALEENNTSTIIHNVGNMTLKHGGDKNSDLVENCKEILVVLWIIGILASFLGSLLQISLLIIVRKGRKFDEIVMCQMTLARTMYTVMEYYFYHHVQDASFVTKLFIFFFYIYFDVVSLMLMFVFTQNLYNKVVVVFPLKSYNLVLVSAIVWIASVPVGILCPFLLSLYNGSFGIFYKVYAYVKFIVCCINALIFIRIISVSLKNVEKQRNIKDFLKTSAMAFVLVTVTCLQVLVTDLISFLYDKIKSDLLVSVFCVVYSYQAVICTGIFIVLIKTKINNPIIRVFAIHFNVGLSVANGSLSTQA